MSAGARSAGGDQNLRETGPGQAGKARLAGVPDRYAVKTGGF
jgi:hypothetical protein